MRTEVFSCTMAATWFTKAIAYIYVVVVCVWVISYVSNGIESSSKFNSDHGTHAPMK